MKRKMALATFVFMILSVWSLVALPATVLADSTSLSTKSKKSELSRTEVSQLSVTEVEAMLPIMAIAGSQQVAPAGDTTKWKAGSRYALELYPENAMSINASIDVPDSQPSSNDYYGILLSAFDSAQSYDQIGLMAYQGAWYLVYSYSTGPPIEGNFHLTRAPASQGTTYSFNITVQNGLAYFTACQGSTVSLSGQQATGGNYLIIACNYIAYGVCWDDYTDYEEIKQTKVDGGAPSFNFHFYNQSWVATNGTSYAPTWSKYIKAEDGYSMPPYVGVAINGDSVLVINLGVDLTVSSVDPVPPHYSVFQVYHHGMRLNGQNISMTYTVTVSRTDLDPWFPHLFVEVGLKRTNVNNASD